MTLSSVLASKRMTLRDLTRLKVGDILPIVQEKAAVEFVSITDEMKEGSVYLQMREARNQARTIGPKAVAKKLAEEAEKASKGKKKKKKK